MSDPQITGLVALIEDEYTLVINKGVDAGVTPGMIFAVFSGTGQVITDPESGRVLGRLSEETLRVRVFDVHELFARAETFATEVQGRPGRPMAHVLHTYETKLLDAAAAPIGDGMAELARHPGDGDTSAVTATPPDEAITINVGDVVELVDAARTH